MIVIIGNKYDLADKNRQVDYDDAKFLADNNGLTFIEASAKDGSNVDLAFAMIVEKIGESQIESVEPQVVRLTKAKNVLEPG